MLTTNLLKIMNTFRMKYLGACDIYSKHKDIITTDKCKNPYLRFKGISLGHQLSPRC